MLNLVAEGCYNRILMRMVCCAGLSGAHVYMCLRVSEPEHAIFVVEVEARAKHQKGEESDAFYSL